MRCLNFGCGPDTREEWTNFDKDFYASADQGDILDGLPYRDEEFDVIVGNHSLQMIRYTDVPLVLGEFHRVLKPGGVLRLLVPDMLSALESYRRGDAWWFPIVNEAEKSLGGKLCAYVSWYSEANLQFTPAWLAELVQRNGFTAAVVINGMSAFGPEKVVELDSRPNESIVVEGLKIP